MQYFYRLGLFYLILMIYTLIWNNLVETRLLDSKMQTFETANIAILQRMKGDLNLTSYWYLA